MLRGAADRRRRDHNDRAWLAHQTAFLVAYAPKDPKRFPKLERMQIRSDAEKPRGARSWQDQLSVMQAVASRPERR